jgi:hypothetical protein
MTTTKGKPDPALSRLKAALVTGAVVASLAGARLLGLVEPPLAAALPANAIIVPLDESAPRPADPAARPVELPGGTGLLLSLPDIPDVVQPVARSHSSR